MGNSFGGLLALAFAAAHPERARGVVLIDGHLGEQGWTEKMAATLELEGEERDRRIATSFEHWLGRHSEKKSTRLARSAAALVYETSLLADLRGTAPLTGEDFAKIEAPVLAIYGERSDLRARGEACLAKMRNKEILVVDGCTHSVLWEALPRVRELVVDFLRQVVR